MAEGTGPCLEMVLREFIVGSTVAPPTVVRIAGRGDGRECAGNFEYRDFFSYHCYLALASAM